ncbi:MAG: LysM peptidoglycan-binding domain-containing protein [bacterium]
MKRLLKKIGWYLISSKFSIFIFGVAAGWILSVVVLKIPTEYLFSTHETDIEVETRKFDPFEKFTVPLNDRISAKINSYLSPGRRVDLLSSYKRSGKYLPMITAIFEEYNLPQYLVYLPILESRFLPNSRSRAGAVGLWQIMPVTASEYGLKYNRWIDERRDPEKSTIVAAEYLQFLYDKFKNWELVLAAYNYGYGKLLRAMRRDKAKSFWQLKRIPRETYNFVPNFYAILHIFANPEKYGVRLPDKNTPLEYETIDIEATFSIDQIARLANVSPSIIKSFNPALTGNIAPSGKYSIRVPTGVKEHFLVQYKKNPLDRVEITYTTYRVKKGDSLYKIAKNFGTTVNAIRADNNLRSSRWIPVGLKLRIAAITVIKQSVSPETTDMLTAQASDSSQINKIKFVYNVEREGLDVATLARYYAVSENNLKEWNPWLDSNKLQQGEDVYIFKSLDEVTFHRTRRGDSLWRLAKRYHTTVANLKRWNQIWGSKIYPGSRLIVGLRG